MWRIIRKRQSYSHNTRKCCLWLNRKLDIALYESENLLNKKWNSCPNVVIKASSCYCVMILKAVNDVNFKETITL